MFDVVVAKTLFCRQSIITLFDRSYRSVSHSPLKSYYVFVKAQNKLLNQQDISDLISFVFEKNLEFSFSFLSLPFANFYERFDFFLRIVCVTA